MVYWAGRAPRTLETIASFIDVHDRGDMLWTGYRFPDRDDAILTIHEQIEYHQRRHNFSRPPTTRYDDTCIRGFCVNKRCKFFYEAMRIRGQWLLNQFEGHSDKEDCTIFNFKDDKTIYRGKSAYKSKYFIPLVIVRIERNLSLRKAELMSMLTEYVNTSPHPAYIARLRKTALKQYIGTELNYLQSMPYFIEKLNQAGHSAKLINLSKNDMIEVAVNFERRRIEQLNKYKPDHMPKTTFDEETVRDVLDHKMREDVRYGYAVLFCSKVSKAMFSILVPVFSADAAHCNNVSKSLMFTLYGQNANRQKVNLGIMFVADNESEKTWRIFLEFVRESMRASWERKAMITDQDKGAKNAIEKELLGVHQFLCVHHRTANVRKQCSAEDARVFGEAVNTFIDSKLQEVKAIFSAKAQEYVGRVPDDQQYPVSSQVCLFGRSTTLVVEGMNAANLKFRGMGMYRGFVEFLKEDGRRHIDCAKVAMATPESKVLPNVQLKINNTNARSMSGNSSLVRNQDLDYTVFEVPSAKWPGHCYHIDLAERTCSCGEWQTTRFPCIHVFRVCRYAALELYNYLDHYDTSWH